MKKLFNQNPQFSIKNVFYVEKFGPAVRLTHKIPYISASEQEVAYLNELALHVFMAPAFAGSLCRTEGTR